MLLGLSEGRDKGGHGTGHSSVPTSLASRHLSCLLLYLFQPQYQGWADDVGHSTGYTLHSLLSEESVQTFPCQQGTLSTLLCPSVSTVVTDLYQLEQREAPQAEERAP